MWTSSGRSAWTLISALAVMAFLSANVKAATYQPGFTWDLGHDFDILANATATSHDSKGAAVWQYYGGQRIRDDVRGTGIDAWADRMPQDASLLPDARNVKSIDADPDLDWVMYSNEVLDTAAPPKKQTGDRTLRVVGVVSHEHPNTVETVYLDTRDQRLLGVRWVAPVAGVVNVTGSVGRPSFNNVRWALDSYIGGTLKRNLAKGLGGDSAFKVTRIHVNPGDMLMLSIAPNGNKIDVGHSTRTSLTVTLTR